MIVLAARAALVALALLAVAVVARRRGRAAPATAPVAVLARAPLGPGLGVALLETGGRRLLVGWGKDGVRLVRDLGPPEVSPPGEDRGPRLASTTSRPGSTAVGVVPELVAAAERHPPRGPPRV